MTAITYSNLRSAAIDQHWRVERTGGDHAKWIPPDPNMKIVFGSTSPSDRNAARQMLRDLTKSGFVWPWPTPRYEREHLPNGGVEVESFEPITCDEPTEEKVDEVTVTAELNGSGETTLREQVDARVWRRVVTPEDKPFKIIDGYMITEDGECRSPAGKTLKIGVQGSQFYVSLTRADRPGNRTVTVRIDKLVLWSYVGEPRDDEYETPVHKNKDSTDCRLSNLRWLTKDDLSDPTITDKPPRFVPPEHRRSRPLVDDDTPVDFLADRDLAEAEGESSDVLDDVQVSLLFESQGMTLQYRKGGWSITPCENLSNDQLDAVARMITRWKNVNAALGQ